MWYRIYFQNLTTSLKNKDGIVKHPNYIILFKIIFLSLFVRKTRIWVLYKTMYVSSPKIFIIYIYWKEAYATIKLIIVLVLPIKSIYSSMPMKTLKERNVTFVIGSTISLALGLVIHASRTWYFYFVCFWRTLSGEYIRLPTELFPTQPNPLKDHVFIQRRTALGINQNNWQCGADNIIAASADSVSSRGRFRIKFPTVDFSPLRHSRVRIWISDGARGRNSNQRRDTRSSLTHTRLGEKKAHEVVWWRSRAHYK